jgi:hypothetical protein
MNQSAALEHLLNTAVRRIADLDKMVAAQAQEIFDLRRQCLIVRMALIPRSVALADNKNFKLHLEL